MNAGVSIRRLSERDSIAELTVLLHAAYAALGAQGFNFTAVNQSEEVTRERVGEGECYVAISDGGMVGAIVFRRRAAHCPWFDQTHVGVMNQFGVAPAFQGRGIGARLLEHVEARARETGCGELALDTSEGALDLIQWYEKRGYRSVGYAQWPGKVYRSILLSKALR